MITAGIGCRRGCSATDIVAVLQDAERKAGVLAGVMAAPAFKASEPGLAEASRTLGMQLVLIDGTALEAAQPGSVTQSETVRAHTGVASVAEACALAAAGPGATLLQPRIAHPRATCALAASAVGGTAP